MPKDLRYFLKQLAEKRPKEFLVVNKEVDPRFELTGVLRKLQEEGRFPAVLFERVKNSEMPVIANLTASEDLLAIAMGVEKEKLLQTYIEREERRLKPNVVKTGPVQDVVLKGDDVDLYKLPIVRNCEKDGNDFVTAGITIVKDPDTGVQNCGIYRMARLSKNRLGLSYEEHTHIAHIHQKFIAQDKPMEVATYLGHHPAHMIGSQSKVPLGVDELDVTGGLLEEPVDVVKCKTVDLYVPAWAEIVFEGLAYSNDREPEGPFGEYTWYYGGERNSPVMQLTAITHRKDAIYQHLFAAHPEHNFTGKLGRESVLYKRVKQIMPSVIDVAMPMSGVCRAHAYVKIKKEYDGAGKVAALSALASDPFVKLAVVVDEDIDIHNDSEVWWAICTRVQPDKSVFFISDAGVSRLDPSAYSIWSRLEKDGLNTKWAIDATKPRFAFFEERAEVPEKVWKNIKLSDYIKPEKVD